MKRKLQKVLALFCVFILALQTGFPALALEQESADQIESGSFQEEVVPQTPEESSNGDELSSNSTDRPEDSEQITEPVNADSEQAAQPGPVLDNETESVNPENAADELAQETTEPDIQPAAETDADGFTRGTEEGSDYWWKIIDWSADSGYNVTAPTTVIKGTKMPDWAEGEARPWVSAGDTSPWGYFRDRFIIEPGMTNIGSYAFNSENRGSINDPDQGSQDDWYFLFEIEIPGSVTKIGSRAFARQQGLGGIWFDGDAPEIAADAFVGVNAVAYYPANNATWTVQKRQNYGGALTWTPIDENGFPIGFIRGIEADSDYWWKLDTDGTLTIKGTEMGEWNQHTAGIPHYRTAPWDCFSFNDKISNVVIEDGITAIKTSAFYGQRNFNNIKTIQIPASVNLLEFESMICLSNTTPVELHFAGDAPEFWQNSLNNNHDDGCFNLSDVKIYYPANNSTWTEEVRSQTYGAKKIEWVAVESTPEEDGFTRGTEEGSDYWWKTIDWSADSGYNVLAETTVIKGTKMPDWTNGEETPWASFRDRFIIESGMTNIGSYAFNRESKGSITAEDSGGDWESNWYFLFEIQIPASVTRIGKRAFGGQQGLGAIWFDGDAPEIAADAFVGVNAVAYYPANNATWTVEKRQNYGGALTWTPFDENGYPIGFIRGTEAGSDYWWKLGTDGTLTIKGTEMGEWNLHTALIPHYRMAPWDCFDFNDKIINVVIEDGITAVKTSAFYGQRNFNNIRTIQIPASVNLLEFESTSYLPNPMELYFAGNAPEIKTFHDLTVTIHYPANDPTWTEEVRSKNYGAKSITWVAVEDGPKDDGFIRGTEENSDYWWKFDENTGTLTIKGTKMSNWYKNHPAPWYAIREQIGLVEIMPGITNTGDTAFDGCISLTGITIPEGVTNIGSYTFRGCSSLTEITIPNGVTSIDYFAFSDCSSLTKITIPESMTSVLYSAFRGCSSLTEVTIPEGVTSIGNRAFLGCTSLTEITIPESITNIGDSVFSGCTSLTEITIPKSVTSIGDFAFDSCRSLTKISIPKGVTSIGSSAFRYCSSLTEITIPESVANIGVSAFFDCRSLTEITIPEGVTSIGDCTFLGCSSLTEITIPESVVDIGASAFYDCRSLTEIVIPEGVISIGDHVFYSCTSLIKITIPGSVTNIGDFAFWSCTSLAEVMIPEGITKIGDHTFWNCCSLTKITIPEDVTNIGASAFGFCISLPEITIPASVHNIGNRAFTGNRTFTTFKTIRFMGDAPEMGADLFVRYNGNNETRDHTVTAYYPYGNPTWTAEILGRDDYGANVIWVAVDENGDPVHRGTEPNSDYWWKIVDGVLTISGTKMPDWDGVAQDMAPWSSRSDEIQKIVVEPGMTNIGNRAFSGLNDVTSVELPESVLLIGNSVFGGCSSLLSLTIPKNVAQIRSMAFTFSGITSFAVDSGNTAFSAVDGFLCSKNGARLIAAPAGLTGKIAIPDCVVTIGDGAFWGCRYDNVVIPNSVETIGAFAFYLCPRLTSVTIPESVKKIETYAFGTIALKEIRFMGDAPDLKTGWCLIGPDTTQREIVAFYPAENVTYTDALRNRNDFGAKLVWTPVDKAGDVVHRGTEPNSDYWWKIVDGVLTISGTKMPDWAQGASPECPAPWGGYGFYKIVIQPGMTNIGNCAFLNVGAGGSSAAGGLVVEIPASVKTIGREAFKYCNITEIQIPEGVTRIRENAFAYCGELKTVSLPDSLITIERDAFFSCGKLTRVRIPQNTSEIARRAFGASGVTAFEVDEANPNFRAINGFICSKDGTQLLHAPCGVKGQAMIPNGIVTVCEEAFTYGDWTGVTLPNTVVTIENNAFSCCNDIKKLVIPTSVKSIGEDAFYALEPESIRFMGDAPLMDKELFSYESRVFNAYYPAGNATWTREILDRTDYGSKLVWIAVDENGNPTQGEGFVRGNEPGSDYEWRLDANGDLIIRGTKMPDWSSADNTHAPWMEKKELIKRVFMQNGFENVGAEAFGGCPNLSYAVIMEQFSRGTIAVGSSAFAGCPALRSVVGLGNAVSVGDEAFFNCTALGSVGSLNAVTIGEGAFLNCSSLGGSVWLYDTETIGASAFEGCSSLERFIVDGNCPGFSARGDILYNKDGTLLIQAPGAISGTVTLPEGVKEIGKFAFMDCKKMAGIVLPSSLVTIGDTAFCGCAGLSSVSIPGNVAEIKAQAFAECSNLKQIAFVGNAPDIARNAFSGVTANVDYPVGNATWTTDKLQNYGGHLTWGKSDTAVIPSNQRPQSSGKTPQQTADELARQIYISSDASSLAKKLIEVVRENEDVFVTKEISEAMAGAISASGVRNQTIRPENGSYVSAAYAAGFEDVLEITELTANEADNSLVLTAAFRSGKQSPTGVYMTLYLKEKLDPTLEYIWVCEGQSGYAEIAAYGKDGYETVVTFFAPHFSTYEIVATSAPVKTEVSSSTDTAEPEVNIIPEDIPGRLFSFVVWLVLLLILATGGVVVIIMERSRKGLFAFRKR